MINNLQVDRWKTKPYAHQIADAALLLKHEFFFLASEMGTGKTKTVIDAACLLRDEELINIILVISPAAVRGVWLDEDFGEIRKHSWVASEVFEFHSKMRRVWQDTEPRLAWIVTNYEFVRNPEHREKLKTLLHGLKVLLVLDESSFIKNRRAAQTKACMDLGKIAARKVILNGTPIGNNPFDLWSQANFLSPRILPYKNFFHFRSEFAIMGGWHQKQVIQWKNLDRLQQHLAPYVIRREKKDCLDLPEKIYTQLECPLTDETWKIYKTMRDEAVVWLDKNPTLAAQAGVRVMRLSQITSGFLGGFSPEGNDVPLVGEQYQTIAIGREKLDLLREWVKERLVENPGFKVIVWCRFRLELERVASDLKDIIPTFRLYGQGKTERTEAIARFSDVNNPKPALLAGQVQAGGFGLNLVAADHVVYLSNDFNMLTRLQSEDRVHRPGQKNNVLYLDVLATGPKGQRTVDHSVVKALRAKNDLATWTVAAWKKVLEES